MPSSAIVGHSGGIKLGKYGPATTDRRPITSTGRMNPAPHISHITMNVMVVNDKENRVDDNEFNGQDVCVAPLLSRDDGVFTTRKGDIALYRPNDYYNTSNQC